MTKPLYLTDRTTIETEWHCGMKRWFYKEEGGTGIVPKVEAVYYEQGRQLHHHLAQLLTGTPLEAVLEELGPPPLADQALLEPWSRLTGWLTAFHDFLLPQWLAQYEVILVEQELILERGSLWVANTADAVLRDKTDKRLVVIDFKSVGMLTKNWVDHWPYAVQMHINTKAVGEELGETPKYALVVGAQKGQERYGRLAHPYVWAYSDGSNWSGDYKKYGDWTNRMVVEYDSGVVGWARHLGPEVGFAQFPISAPIIFDERLLDQLIQDRTKREYDVRDVREDAQTNFDTRRAFFTQNFNNCRPVIGTPCPYLECCHNAEIQADPLASGLYVPRTPHHEVELIGVAED